MKANELMIGDFLQRIYNNKIIKVNEIRKSCIYTEDNGYEYNEVAPIPLTKEILEKNEFAYCASSGAFICYAEESYAKQIVSVILFHVGDEYRNNQLHICNDATPDDHIIHLMDCNYVHELQHALRLCGIDKTIEL